MTLAWQEARRRASQLRHEFATTNPYEICSRLGIDVTEASLPLGVSGLIVKQRDHDELSDVPGRRRFTCAHELGHFVERMNVTGDDDFSFRDRRGAECDLHEFFADEFACELLMPADEFLAAFDAGASPTTLAARYGVTAKGVGRRLGRLPKNPPLGD